MQFENGTDVQFMNEYVQVVSQNLDVIMKNSFLLQAKYNVLEKALNHKITTEGQSSEHISELNRQISVLGEERVQLLQQIESIRGEKQRIQDAFNQEMREHSELKNKVMTLDGEIELMNSEKLKLEKNNQKINNELTALIEENKDLKSQIASLLYLSNKNTQIEQKVNDEVISKKNQKVSKKEESNKTTKIEVKSGGTF